MPPRQFADPRVSRRKFEREVSEFRSMGGEYRKRGWFLAEADYPRIIVVMAAPKLVPSAIVTGVAFDYTNYDAAPPSVLLVHPYTGEPYKGSELPTQLLRSLPDQKVQLVGGLEHSPQFALQAQQALMQAITPEEIPFLCLAGVREYHDHPAHSGDSWELYRASGAGRLVRLLEIISKYGTDPLNGYAVQMIPKIQFAAGQPPPP